MTSEKRYPQPNARRLQIYSFDPALTARYDLAGTSRVTIDVPWESDLLPGPVGEYVEVVDVGPAAGAAYAPVDLNAPELLATDGMQPSESDPRFHQQMVLSSLGTAKEQQPGKPSAANNNQGDPAGGARDLGRQAGRARVKGASRDFRDRKGIVIRAQKEGPWKIIIPRRAC